MESIKKYLIHWVSLWRMGWTNPFYYLSSLPFSLYLHPYQFSSLDEPSVFIKVNCFVSRTLLVMFKMFHSIKIFFIPLFCASWIIPMNTHFLIKTHIHEDVNIRSSKPKEKNFKSLFEPNRGHAWSKIWMDWEKRSEEWQFGISFYTIRIKEENIRTVTWNPLVLD